MYLIGLTGNIGTGKSTVGALLREQGAFVVDADQVYRRLIEPDQPGHRAVIDLFGPAILSADGQVDRRALGEIVFRDPEALGRLERATHPLVRAEVEAILAREKPSIAVYEAIKLIESGAADACDEVWVVTAPRSAQIERLIAARGLSHAEATLRVDALPAEAEKIRRADLVLSNDADLETLRTRVAREWQRVKASA